MEDTIICPMRREQCSIKHLKRCGTPRKKTVYGLADASIIATILYVGSTFYPVKRFVAHMSQNIQGELKTLIRDVILESGSYLSKMTGQLKATSPEK